MPETKTRAPATRSKRNSAGGTRSRNASNRSRSSSNGSKAAPRAASRRGSPSRRGSTRRRPTRRTRRRLSEVVSKAKTPLIAGGAALAGAAGGMALSRNGTRRKVLGVAMPHIDFSGDTRKALGGATRAFGNAAKELGKAGYQLGQLTSEVRRVRERVSDG
jgi:hypothetical protein